jgi:hypothetical protein
MRGQWWWRAAAGLSAVVAVVLLLAPVRAGSAPDAPSCGNAFDVLVDRTDWAVWYGQDRADPAAADDRLRTRSCPGAVNGRLAVAATVGGAALVTLVLARTVRPRRADPPGAAARPLERLDRLGRWTASVGAVLLAGGLAALAFVLADAGGPLFTFVGRPAVLALGLVALTPVVALVVLGRALVLVAHRLAGDGVDDVVP